MRELIVGKNEEGQRFNKYLLKYFNAGTSSFVYKMLRKKNIVLNDKKAKGDEILKYGDSVKLYLADETIGKFHSEAVVKVSVQDKFLNQIKILYQDNDIIALHKPAGMLSQKAKPEDYSINEYVIDRCIRDGLLSPEDMRTFKPSVANRLDRNTSGIILAGISLKGSQYLGRALKGRSLDKYYYTIVKGVMKNDIRCQGYLHKDYPENKSTVIGKAAYLRLNDDEKTEYSGIDTEFIPLASNDAYTLLKVKIYTGKSHQIRAHLKAMGYSVLGDKKYGEHSVNRYIEGKYGLRHHLLHSGLLVMDRMTDGGIENKGKLIIRDELPGIFIDICKGENIPWEPGTPED